MRCYLILLWAWLATAAVSFAAPVEQWILVAAPAFREALAPLCDHRRAEGMHVVVVDAADASKTRSKIQQLCRDFKGKSYVLLAGATAAGEGRNRLPDSETKIVPPFPGRINRMKGQPSDNAFGCLDDGLLPSVAVGRFPARTPAETQRMVQKTIAFETDKTPGEWRRRFTLLVGSPTFNATMDSMAEKVAKGRLSQIDPSWSAKAIFHNPQSPLCVPDAALSAQAVKYIQEGQLLTLYLGHSDAQGFAAINAHFMDRADWARLAIPSGPGIFATFGCNGCQLLGPDGEGYGLMAMRNPRGPVAVIGSHAICFGAMVHLAAERLIAQLLTRSPPPRLGDVWLSVKEGVAKDAMNPFLFRIYDALDGDSSIPQATQRLEHLEMFLLLGDPALRLPVLPVDLTLTVPLQAQAGETITVRGATPPRLKGAKLRLTLERTLTSDAADLQGLDSVPAARRAGAMLANHEKSNRFALASAETAVQERRFEARLKLPDQLPWPRLIVRAYAATDKDESMGVAVLNVTKSDNAGPKDVEIKRK